MLAGGGSRHGALRLLSRVLCNGDGLRNAVRGDVLCEFSIYAGVSIGISDQYLNGSRAARCAPMKGMMTTTVTVNRE